MAPAIGRGALGDAIMRILLGFPQIRLQINLFALLDALQSIPPARRLGGGATPTREYRIHRQNQ
jgi:hypothetical protein